MRERAGQDSLGFVLQRVSFKLPKTPEGRRESKAEESKTQRPRDVTSIETEFKKNVPSLCPWVWLQVSKDFEDTWQSISHESLSPESRLGRRKKEASVGRKGAALLDKWRAG